MAWAETLSGTVTINGKQLRRAFSAATRCLERYRDAINALNVFPVPDGDTGTNMLLTMRSAEEETQQVGDSPAGESMEAMAHGALLGARGNSGVILSQFLRGMATAFRGKNQLSGEDVAHSFELASQAAYTAMSRPVEGTMLTVMRELSLAARESVAQGATEPLTVCQAATTEAKKALARTPSQLPVLKEAGVVDAGGQGIALLLEGITCYLAGENVDEQQFEICSPDDVELVATPLVHEGYLASTAEEEYGYCVQFLLRGTNLDLSAIRERLSAECHSTGVVGDHSLARIHIHATDPDPVLSYAASLGDISQVKIDNIDEQRQEFVAYHRRQRQTSRVAMVAVAQGKGFTQLFHDLGCKVVVHGGQSMNPSTQELMDAAERSAGAEIRLLPNNPNVILAANQAASLYGPALHVIPSRSIPQGIAALLAFNEDQSLESNLKAMEEALDTVKTIEVTEAVRASNLGGFRVTRGQYIALVEGHMVAAGDSPSSVLEQAVLKSGTSRGNLVTLYWGASLKERDAEKAAERLATLIPGLEVELHEGGQPLYHYIASVE